MSNSFHRPAVFLVLLCGLLLAISAGAQQIDIHGPAGSDSFGTAVAVLPNGNIVVTDPAGDAPQLAFCWAHARPKIYDVFVATKSPIAEQAVQRIAALYAIESSVRGSTLKPSKILTRWI